ncbi:MAG: L,D-transpeptidase [Anaerolineales bacterium]|nr:L,D-transpeptidase [Anaerolineales bacterium]
MFRQIIIGIVISLIATSSVEASSGVCFAHSYDGPVLCPTEEIHQVSVPRRIDLPTLAIEPVEYENFFEGYVANTPDVYAWIDDYSPIYGHPAEAAANLPPIKVSEPGFTYMSLEGETEYEGELWYQINSYVGDDDEPVNEWVHEDLVHFIRPSTFAGVHLASQPSIPFAWVLRNVRPSSLPGAEADSGLEVRYRYDRVNIYGVENVDGTVWYLVDANQWIQQTYLGIVDVTARPAGIPAGEKWIEVDLYEQTLAAYEGDRMVYATLVSSGLPQWSTRRGLFRIWEKVYVAKMSGREGKSDYYFLEDVPWTMYFDWDIGLHGAYWHDAFGYRHSHGCVNLPPISALWLYQWSDPPVPAGVNRYDATGTWVWVH